jgi:hypothetical protein
MEYKGIVVGGWEDGKMLSSPSTVVRYEEDPRAVFAKDLASAPSPELGSRREQQNYYFTSMSYYHLDEVRHYGFWVLKGANIHTALDAVFARYQEPYRDRSLLRRARTLLRKCMIHMPMLSDFQLQDDLLKTMSEIEEVLDHEG